MSSNERRIVPRKAYAIPVRFNVLSARTSSCRSGAKMGIPRGAANSWTTIPLPQHGETVTFRSGGSVSRRGID